MLERLTSETGSGFLPPAYVAGMVDADGSIGIGKTFRGGHEKYTIRVDVSQSAKGREALSRMQQAFGGAVYRQRRPSETQLAQYVWMLSGTAAAATIKAILPYLLVKRPQAHLALQAWETIGSAPRVGRSKWTPALCAQVRQLKAEMSSLNKLGP